MLPFILPWVRRSKVEWFMNQYTEDLVLYPEADFSFVGHSNGTYLLAKALEEYPSCHFANVVFAGSVVRTRYNWPQLIWEGRIKRVLNYVATADWVVALSTKGFQTLGFQDLGSAGFDGFVDGFANFENPSSARQISETPPACQIKYVVGTHSTALKEGHWDDIANFIVHGQLAESKPKEEDEKLFRGTQSILVALGGVFFLLIWMIIAVVVIGIAVWIWNYPQGAEWVKTLVLVLYAALVWTVVTQL
jgi:pimeloyl-ACP methyl ester carboxylesterase